MRDFVFSSTPAWNDTFLAILCLFVVPLSCIAYYYFLFRLFCATSSSRARRPEIFDVILFFSFLHLNIFNILEVFVFRNITYTHMILYHIIFKFAQHTICIYIYIYIYTHIHTYTCHCATSSARARRPDASNDLCVLVSFSRILLCYQYCYLMFLLLVCLHFSICACHHHHNNDNDDNTNNKHITYIYIYMYI